MVNHDTEIGTENLARARLALLGLAVGDAFGEAMVSAEAQRLAPKRVAPVRRPWRWTDDTAMALSIVEVLGRRGTIDPDALAAAFVRRWYDEPHRGYGHGAFTLLTRLLNGGAWRVEAPSLFGGTGSFGNGAAMRAAPIGAYFAGDLARVRDEALRSAAPTHAHPDGAAGAVAVAIAAAHAATGGEAGALLPLCAEHTPPGRTLDGIRAAMTFGLGEPADSVAEVLGTGLQVASHDTVPFCLWLAARHLASYEDAVWAAATPRGDRDTNAAIVGGIVVLATGEAGIPVLWRAATEPVPDPLASPTTG